MTLWSRDRPDGDYACWCRKCNSPFSGYKRDTVCMICAMAIEAQPPVVVPADAPGGAGGTGEPGALVAALTKEVRRLGACTNIYLTVAHDELRDWLPLIAEHEARWQADRLRAETAEAHIAACGCPRPRLCTICGLTEPCGLKGPDGVTTVCQMDETYSELGAKYVAARDALADLRAGVKKLADEMIRPSEQWFKFALLALLPGPDSDARPAGDDEGEGEPTDA